MVFPHEKTHQRKIGRSGSDGVRKAIIVGLPNTGKSQVFNNLTGEYTVVANYPMTTVETRSARTLIAGSEYEIIDTPGLHCLFIHSEEELLIRDTIFQVRPDLLIQCIDANRLGQSLFLTADLIELDIPIVISLNAMDETERQGVRIDADALARVLGVPVVESSSTEGRGIAALRDALPRAATVGARIGYGERIERMVRELTALLPRQNPFGEKIAHLLLAGDPYLKHSLSVLDPGLDAERMLRKAAALRKSFRGNPGRIMNRRKQKWVESVSAPVMQRERKQPGRAAEEFSRLSRHPLWGFPIMGFFVFFTYHMVVTVAGLIADGMNLLLVDPTVGLLDRLLPDGPVQAFLIGEYGILTLGLFNAVATVLPVLSVFFLVFGFLEDIGYLPNLTVLVKRIFEKLGLSGKSVMPIVLGFGCKTMATLTARSIPNRKERLIAIYLIAFAIPCSAQLGLNMAILGIAGFDAFLIAMGFLVLVEIGAGVVLNRIIPGRDRSSFIQELPPFRLPDPVQLLRKTSYRLYWFLKESIPIFMIAAAVLFLIDLVGLLELLKGFAAPVVSGWLGLPLDMVDALLLTMARHEAAAGLILHMSEAGRLTFIQNIVAVVITTMFVPCIANMVAMFREVGAKTGVAMVAAINLSAILLAGLLYRFLVLVY